MTPIPDLPEEFIRSFTALAQTAHANSRAKGFWKLHDIIQQHPTHAKELTTLWHLSRHDLMHTELGEATEGVRKDLKDDHLPHRDMRHCELADVVIRILDVCGAENIPLAEIILEKMSYNSTRPYLHGKKA